MLSMASLNDDDDAESCDNAEADDGCDNDEQMRWTNAGHRQGIVSEHVRVVGCPSPTNRAGLRNCLQ